MKIQSSMWLILRVCFTFLPIYGAVAHPGGIPIALDWPVLILAPLVFAIAIFAWLCFITKYKSVHLEQPFSLTSPFYPMTLYPLRFWLLCGTVFISIGASRVLVSFFTHRQLSDSIFLFVGAGVLVGVLGWMRWARRK